MTPKFEKIDYFLSLLIIVLYIITAIVDRPLLLVMVAFQIGYGIIMGVCIKYKYHESDLLPVVLYVVSVALLWVFIPTIVLVTKGIKKLTNW